VEKSNNPLKERGLRKWSRPSQPSTEEEIKPTTNERLTKPKPGEEKDKEGNGKGPSGRQRHPAGIPCGKKLKTMQKTKW